MNEQLIGIYRKEVDSNDHFHKAMAFILGLLIIGLGISYDITNRIELLYPGPALTIALVGTIIRLDTLVHRMGWLLGKLNDPWEISRVNLKNDKKNLVLADIYVMAPIIFYAIKAFMALWPILWYSDSLINKSLWMLSTTLITLGVMVWARTPSQVRIEKRQTSEPE